MSGLERDGERAGEGRLETEAAGTTPRLAGLPRPPRPWYAQIAGQWPLAITLLGIALGVVVMGASFWRRGATMIGLTVAGASVLRLVLPARMVGLLEVRSRWLDTLILFLIGSGILITAWLVPPIRK
jgi:hypothetical protein